MKDVVMVTATAQWGTYGGWQGQRVVTDPQEALDLCAEIEGERGPLLPERRDPRAG
jgi:hypothetical protein